MKEKSIARNLRDSLRWNDILRFRLIEIIAFWEGRLTTNHICDAYNIVGVGKNEGLYWLTLKVKNR